MIKNINDYYSFFERIISELDKNLMGFIDENMVFFFILTTVFVVYLKEYTKRNIYLTSIAYLVGTFFHELAHYIAALLTTLRFPSRISIFPEKMTEEIINNNGEKETKIYYVLGYVKVNSSRLNILNSFIIGFAPLVLMYLSYIVYKEFFFYYEQYFELNTFAYVLYVFLIVTLFVNSIPSRADLELSKTSGSIYFWALVLVVSFIYYEEIYEVKDYIYEFTERLKYGY